MGNGVAHPHLRGGLDATDDIAHVACTELFARFHVEFEDAYLIGMVVLLGADEFDPVASLDAAVDDAEIADDAAEGVEDRVENKGLKGCLGVALGGWHTVHDGL